MSVRFGLVMGLIMMIGVPGAQACEEAEAVAQAVTKAQQAQVAFNQMTVGELQTPQGKTHQQQLQQAYQEAQTQVQTALTAWQAKQSGGGN